jgi:hypothetical protein
MVRPSTETTYAEDYAALEALFLSLLAGVILIQRRQSQAQVAALAPRDLPVMALATFALADTVAKEKVSTWLRQPFVIEDSDHHPLKPRGRGLRRATGELLTCTRCAGTWCALLLVGLQTASPAAGLATTNVLALAGANDLLQAVFHLLVTHSDLADLAVQSASRPGLQGPPKLRSARESR